MLNSYKLQHPPKLPLFAANPLSLRRRIPILRPHGRRPASLSLHTAAPPETSLISSVGHPPVVQWSLTQRHLTILNFSACAVAVSATWLFLAAIPALLAFKRAAESMEKLMDVTREELPDTMAAVRLSGMEISDLTMELSDIGQEITQGVKSSTRAVRMAEERLRKLTTMTPPASMQGAEPIGNKTSVPVVAKTARGIRESIVKGRSILQMLISITRYSGVAFKYLRLQGKARV